MRLLINAGVYGHPEIIERRRTRLVNIFNSIGGIIIVLFGIINFVVGSYFHTFTILSGLVLLTIPVHQLNARKYTTFAKYYLVIATWLFANGVGYITLFNNQSRDNEFFFIGFSAIIIALFDHKAKLVLFITAAFSTMLMKYIRITQHSNGVLIADDFLALTNLFVAFICVYFFTNVFKLDLQRSEQRIRLFSQRIEQQNSLVQYERDNLLYNKHLLRTTIDNLPIFIALIDKSGHFIIVNNRFEDVLVKKIEAIEGKHYSEILGDQVADMVTPLFNRSLEGHESDIDSPVTFQNGEFIHAYGKYIPVRNRNGQVSRVLAYVADISKMKETERELMNANASKDKVLSILSHDLRSPLVSLGGLLVYADDIEPKKFKALMGTVKQQVDSISFTLDNVLTWVKSQLGAFAANPNDVNLNFVASSVLELYRESFKEKSIALDNEIPNNINVFVDPDHLAIVIRNLVSNAIKFTPSAGQITLSGSAENGNVFLSVKDSGIGMCQDTIASVLEGINKNKNSTRLGTNGEKGTGLGLNFCLDILQLNNGGMEIKSEPDQGTEIVVSLPAA
ncbi:MAG: PAS domain-containing sensor histidine kinase [Reichenbachiella sp.]|uniref:sensor histidine kinase n=1 Tax=Reichenbachiella sp. TaxID=2184521 RepID=UPI00329895AC